MSSCDSRPAEGSLVQSVSGIDPSCRTSVVICVSHHCFREYLRTSSHSVDCRGFRSCTKIRCDVVDMNATYCCWMRVRYLREATCFRIPLQRTVKLIFFVLLKRLDCCALKCAGALHHLILLAAWAA